MKKPEVKFFKTILGNMLEHRTTVLSQLGDTKKMPAKELKNYYSRHLGKEAWSDLKTKVEKRMIQFIGKIDKQENCICFDTVDTNKNAAKKMEGLKIVRDGSMSTLGNGFTWHGVSVKGIPLFLHRERIKEDKDISLRFEMFEQQLKKIQSIFGSGYWVLADRGYDDFKKYNLLIELGFSFCIRLKINRKLQIMEGKQKGEQVKSGELESGKYRVRIKGVTQDLYVFVRKLKGLKNPIRVISNTDNGDNIERYLKRWEIERIFKTCKQEFDFEKIGTKSIQKTENLVYLVQLCFGISAYIFNTLEAQYEFGQEKNETISLEKMYKKISPFFKEKGLTLNRNSITKFLAHYMQFIYLGKAYFGKPTLKPRISAQLCLF